MLIANERASSIIHHDGVFFIFDTHFIDQNGRYFSNNVSCMTNQVCNKSIFDLNGVNISIKNISDANSDISTTRKNGKARNEEIISNQHYLGPLSTNCKHCQVTSYEKETKHKQCCEFGAF
uniref:Uncharacterized protein n=1 Tax=Strongyloides venezuelensis TaxID=75913 RepID=A0A0K0FS28_STRVS